MVFIHKRNVHHLTALRGRQKERKGQALEVRQ